MSSSHLSLFARGMLAVVRFYQRNISPYTPPSCRFTPSCSEYTAQAITRFGGRGVWMGIKRVFRCNPWTPGGHDPVPEDCSNKKPKDSDGNG